MANKELKNTPSSIQQFILTYYTDLYDLIDFTDVNSIIAVLSLQDYEFANALFFWILNDTLTYTDVLDGIIKTSYINIAYEMEVG